MFISMRGNQIRLIFLQNFQPINIDRPYLEYKKDYGTAMPFHSHSSDGDRLGSDIVILSRPLNWMNEFQLGSRLWPVNIEANSDT